MAGWLKRPMLAAAADANDIAKLDFPVYGTPKLDGIRCLIHPILGPVTRSFKLVPNNYIRSCLADERLKGLDGEIMMYGEEQLDSPRPFNAIQSAVMSQHGQPLFVYRTFDFIPTQEHAECTYASRIVEMYAYLRELNIPHIMPLKWTELEDADAVLAYAHEQIQLGYEGIVLRHPKGAYKFGRSTLKQQGMIKYKEFSDAEGTVVDFEELYRNQNPQEQDEFGLAKRRDRKEGMVPAGTLGALVLDTEWGRLHIGSGFDSQLRDAIWSNRNYYLGRQVTFKYQTHGMQDLPRFPIFMRFREKE